MLDPVGRSFQFGEYETPHFFLYIYLFVYLCIYFSKSIFENKSQPIVDSGSFTVVGRSTSVLFCRIIVFHGNCRGRRTMAARRGQRTDRGASVSEFMMGLDSA